MILVNSIPIICLIVICQWHPNNGGLTVLRRKGSSINPRLSPNKPSKPQTDESAAKTKKGQYAMEDQQQHENTAAQTSYADILTNRGNTLITGINQQVQKLPIVSAGNIDLRQIISGKNEDKLNVEEQGKIKREEKPEGYGKSVGTSDGQIRKIKMPSGENKQQGNSEIQGTYADILTNRGKTLTMYTNQQAEKIQKIPARKSNTIEIISGREGDKINAEKFDKVKGKQIAEGYKKSVGTSLGQIGKIKIAAAQDQQQEDEGVYNIWKSKLPVIPGDLADLAKKSRPINWSFNMPDQKFSRANKMPKNKGKSVQEGDHNSQREIEEMLKDIQNWPEKSVAKNYTQKTGDDEAPIGTDFSEGTASASGSALPTESTLSSLRFVSFIPETALSSATGSSPQKDKNSKPKLPRNLQTNKGKIPLHPQPNQNQLQLDPIYLLPNPLYPQPNPTHFQPHPTHYPVGPNLLNQQYYPFNYHQPQHIRIPHHGLFYLPPNPLHVLTYIPDPRNFPPNQPSGTGAYIPNATVYQQANSTNQQKKARSRLSQRKSRPSPSLPDNANESTQLGNPPEASSPGYSGGMAPAAAQANKQCDNGKDTEIQQ